MCVCKFLLGLILFVCYTSSDQEKKSIPLIMAALCVVRIGVHVLSLKIEIGSNFSTVKIREADQW